MGIISILCSLLLVEESLLLNGLGIPPDIVIRVFLQLGCGLQTVFHHLPALTTNYVLGIFLALVACCMVARGR